MRKVLLLSLIALVSTSYGQNKTEVPRTFEEFAAELPGVPVEYQADIVFDYLHVHGEQVPKPERLNLLQGVFNRASKARYPTFYTAAAGSVAPLDNQTANLLYGGPLSTLDIQTRAVGEVLPASIGPSMAQALFSSIRLDNKRVNCSETLVPVYDSYYAVAFKIMRALPVEARSAFFVDLVRGVSTPEEMTSFLTALKPVTLSEAEFRTLQSGVENMLDHLTPTDRELRGLYRDTNAGIAALAARYTTAHLSPVSMLERYWALLVRSAKEGCSDVQTDRTQLAKSWGQFAKFAPELTLDASALNSTHTVESPAHPKIPIEPEVFPHLKRLSDAHRERLLAVSAGKTPEAVSTSDDTEAILRAASKVKPSECEVCDFEAKVSVLFMLTDQLPPGQDFERAVNNEVDFLSFNRIEDTNPPFYLVMLKHLVNVSRPVSPESAPMVKAAQTAFANIEGAPSDDAPAIRRALQRSRDPIITLYMRYDAVTKATYQLHPAVIERLRANEERAKQKIATK